MSEPRKLAAILAADVAGYSRLTGLDEEGTLKRLRKLRRELINRPWHCIPAGVGKMAATQGGGRMESRQSRAAGVISMAAREEVIG